MRKSDRQLDLFGATPSGSDTTSSVMFHGIDNPRALRALDALLVGPLTREQLDSVAGCSNCPQSSSDLRDLGPGCVALLCTMMTGTDRDRRRVKYGVYSLTDDGRRVVAGWLAEIAPSEVRHA